jgi:hypothetical protein
MPRPGPVRPIVGVRLCDKEIADIDRRALEENLTIRGGEPNRSQMIRLLVAYAMEQMPAGWRPDAANNS